jgi:hypothetical protein
LYVPAALNVRDHEPADWLPDDAPSSKTILWEEQSWPPYPSPLQVSQVHFTAVPGATVVLEGSK